tara:strand:- start:6741 stop:8015 length:1275 start_codon:yes stop_codon:yes gene_type:complete
MLKKIISKWLALDNWQKIIIALFMGIISGILIGPKISIVQPVGDLFMNALHLLIIPVIFTSVVSAITSMENTKKMKAISVKAFVFYVVSLICGSIIAIIVGNLIMPGLGLNYKDIGAATVLLQSTPSFVEFFTNLVPANPFAAIVNENIIQITIFAILFGVAINKSGEQGKSFAVFFKSLSHVSYKLADIVMSCAPYGVFAFIACTFGSLGLNALYPLVSLIIAYLLASVVLVIIYLLIVTVFMKKSPIVFIKSITSAILLAISTTSSSITVPESIKCAENNLKVTPEIARFLIPLGCSFNLTALVIYLVLSAIFTANIFGINLSAMQYVSLIITASLSSMGVSGLPGCGIIVMGAVLASVNLPLGALSLILGIDRINDMIQTATHVISDIFIASLVCHTEKLKLKVNQEQILKKNLDFNIGSN